MNFVVRSVQSETPDLPGLRIVEEVGRGAESVVYRAIRNDRTVALKVQRASAHTPTRETLRRFRREAAALARVSHPAVVGIFDVGDVSGRPYLVMEYVEGRTLAACLAESPLPQSRIVALGLAMGAALGAVHRLGLVHRDVKPRNIIIDPAGQPRLIDFGFAAQASDDARREVVGTFTYSAPEQTGMLNRPVDQRADLYALGVVLFECATGKPPFRSDDVGNLLRQHAVSAPPQMSALGVDVSAGLQQVIYKLLAKDPDDRYQTTDGLCADLRRLDTLEPASLGAYDQPAETSVGLFAGREAQIEQLRECWELVRRGNGAVALVEGEAGSGKSCLIRHVLEVTRPALVLFAPCRAVEPAPFAPLRAAMETYLRQVMRLPERERASAVLRIRDAAVDLAPLLRQFSPGLAALLPSAGKALDLRRANDQFYSAIAEFLRRLAVAHQGAVLYVDDIQWLDVASQEVVRRLIDGLGAVPLWLLAAGRNDPSSATSTQRFAREAAQALAGHVTLGALDTAAVSALIKQELGGRALPADFVEQLAHRTRGHPLTVIEYLHAMLDAGLLRPSWDMWQVDTAGLADLELPSDVLQLVVKRLGELHDEARQVLGVAAMMGTRFAADILPAACGMAAPQVYQALDEAMRAHLIEQSTGHLYAFVHERVREAVATGVPESSLPDVHLRVASALDARPDDGPDHVYALAHHYARAATVAPPMRVVQTNMAAAHLAQSQFAEEDAYGYLKRAATTVQAHNLPRVADLHRRVGELCLRTGRFEEAQSYLTEALQHATSGMDRAGLHLRLAQMHLARVALADTEAQLRHAFNDLGVRYPKRSVGELMAVIGHHVLFALHKIVRPRSADPSSAGRRRLELITSLFEVATRITARDSRHFEMYSLAVRQLACALPLGVSRELGTAYSYYASTLAVLKRPRAARRYLRQAMQLTEALDNPLHVAELARTNAVAVYFLGASREAEEAFRRTLVHHGRWLDARAYQNACLCLAQILLLRGYADEALHWAQMGMAKMKWSGRNPSEQSNSICVPLAAAAAAVLGRVAEAQQYTDQATFQAERPTQERFALGEYHSNMILRGLEQGASASEVESHIEAFRRLGLASRDVPVNLRHFFGFQAHARLQRCLLQEMAAQTLDLVPLRAALDELQMLAPHDNNLQAHAEVLGGAYARLTGNVHAATAAFERADRLARSLDSPWVRFECARQRALLSTSAGDRATTVFEATLALGIATRHGWVHRAQGVRSQFALVDSTYSGMLPMAQQTTRRFDGPSSLKSQRSLKALLQVSLTVASVLDPEQQAQVALDEIVRLLGAERAFLFLASDTDATLQLMGGRDSEGRNLVEVKGYSSTVVEQVRQSWEACVISGTEEGAIIGSESAVAHNLRSIMAAPLLWGDRLMGVIYMDSRLARGVFTTEDVEILRAIANHIVVALETARAARLELKVADEQRQRRVAESLRDLMVAVTTSLHAEEVLGLLLDGLGRLLPNAAAVALVPQGAALKIAVSRVDTDGDAYAGTEAFVAANATALAKLREPAVMQSWLCVPLCAGGDMVALLLMQRRAPASFSPQDAEVAFTLSSHAGPAVANARRFNHMQQLATVDELTGAFNRRHFFRVAEERVRQARNNGAPCAAIMLDIDHFKSFNDRYGHATGDAVLRAVAACCQASIRGDDVFARYGGEEFAVLLPRSGLAEARDILAERLRLAVANLSVHSDAGPLRVTVSLGVAALTPETGDLATLLKRADAALYEAKRSGRNRVVAG